MNLRYSIKNLLRNSLILIILIQAFLLPIKAQNGCQECTTDQLHT